MAGQQQLAALRLTPAAGALAGAVLLAACGTNAVPASVSHRTTGVQASDALCASPGSVVGLRIREPSPQQGAPGPAVQAPKSVSVASAAQARAIARTVCQLPPIRGLQAHCQTSAQGTVLLLTFSTEHGTLPVVTVQAAGCSTVTGAGPVRWAKARPTLAQGLHAIVHQEPPVIVAN